ncbi:MAG: hypothetical protein J7605_10255 [Variovorax sp.]|nr:hypothetical protein [Variovorax sp.]
MTSMLQPLPLAPVRRASLPVLLATLFAVTAPAANAQWSVVDQQGNRKLDSMNEKLGQANEELKNVNKVLGSTSDGNGASINENIYRLNRRLNLDRSQSPGNRVEDPKQSWTSLQLTQGIEQCNSIASSQKPICEELVRTRNAHYMYMKTMYDNTSTRNQRLTELVDQRGQLGADDFGKLQDNTNQVVTLQTLIALDSQQMESVSHAYQARISFLNLQLTSQATMTTSGQPPDSPIGSIIGSAASGVVLKAALDSSKHSSAPGRRTLTIDQ